VRQGKKVALTQVGREYHAKVRQAVQHRAELTRPIEFALTYDEAVQGIDIVSSRLLTGGSACDGFPGQQHAIVNIGAHRVDSGY
jgi:DNA-binding transcriptional LysR family regulator